MKIAIVDDNSSYVSLIEKIVNSTSPTCLTVKYTDGTEFLKNAYKFDLVFLDIDMPFIDGIEIARFLDEAKIDIVFVTSHSERMIDSFGRNVIGFIQKETLESGIYNIFQKMNEEKPTIIVKSGYHHVKVYLEEIEYIEYCLRDITFHMLNQPDLIIKERSLKDIFAMLNENFIIVNRTTIVNSKYIMGLKQSTLLLNNKKIKVSRRNLKKVQIKVFEKRLAYVRINE